MSTPAGWYPDPTGRHEHRWFDGSGWSDQVADRGATSTDPVAGGGPEQLDPDVTQQVSLDQVRGPAGPTPATQPLGAAPPDTPGGGPPAGGSPGGRGKVIAIGAAVLVGLVVIVAVAVALLGGDDDGGDADRDRSERSEEDEPDEEDEGNGDLTVGDLFGEESDLGDDSSPAPDPDDAPSDDASSGGAYPPEVIDNFLSSCTSSGGTEAACGCIIDVLQRDVPYDRFVELDQQLRENPNDIPPELTAAVEECR